MLFLFCKNLLLVWLVITISCFDSSQSIFNIINKVLQHWSYILLYRSYLIKPFVFHLILTYTTYTQNFKFIYKHHQINIFPYTLKYVILPHIFLKDCTIFLWMTILGLTYPLCYQGENEAMRKPQVYQRAASRPAQHV